MFESLRGRLDRVSHAAQRAAFAAGVLGRSGVLPSLTASGLVNFARAARGGRLGPHTAFLLHAANKPEKTAVIDGQRRISYGELDREINQICHGLVSLGFRPGDRIGVMLGNCVEYLVIQQALSRIGGTVVQIGYRLKASEVAYILENSEPRVVFAHADYFQTVADARAQAGGKAAGGEQHLVVCGTATTPTAARGAQQAIQYDDLRAGQPSDRTPVLKGDAGGAVIVYTSGTTGKPKGAARDLRQTGLEGVFDFMDKVGMSHDDRHLVTAPLYHSAAPAFVAMMFSLGASVVLMDHFDPEATLALIDKERVTCAFAVPTVLARLSALPDEVRKKYDTSSLRWVMSGAAPLPTETARRFQQCFGEVLWNFYGATETGLVTLAGPRDHVSRPGTIGRAVRGNEIRMLGENGREVPTGEVGEVYVRNSMLIGGYHRNAEATRASMRDGFFSVGDLGRVDADGYYYLESRKHDMVISGGVNIYPREIEDHLHTHPAVLEAAVIGIPDPDWGESLKAFVVLRQGARLTEAEVIDFCRTHMADYKRPRKVAFVEELPRNPTGKVLKRELRER